MENGHSITPSLKLLEKLIKRQEDFIVNASVKYQEEKIKFDEIQLNYEIAKEGFERVEKEYKEETGLLDMLIRLRNSDTTHKQIRIVRQTSHLNKPAKNKSKSQKRITWSVHVGIILKEANHFMSKEDIFSTIAARNIFDVTDDKETLYKFRNSISKYMSREGSEFKEYKGKIGLVVWFEGQVPKPQFMKEFVYGNNE